MDLAILPTKIFQTLTPSFSSSGWNPNYEPLSIIDKSWKTHPNIFPKFQFSVARLISGQRIHIWLRTWISFPEFEK